MTFERRHCLLYAVTDRSWLRGRTLAEQVEDALRGGTTMVQLREKELDEESFEREAWIIKDLCHSYGVPFLINDNVELAKKIDADGVHVGQKDRNAAEVRSYLGSSKILGVTAKTPDQARKAERDRADYLGSGAVFVTATKTDAIPMNLDTFQEICESVSIPVVAIGGIHAENIALLEGRKMSGFAIVSGIFAAEDIEAETVKLRKMAERLTGFRN